MHNLYLYYYYERDIGPFKMLTDLPIDQARGFVSKEAAAKSTKHTDIEGFLRMRYDCDDRLRKEFLARGGKVTRKNPVYMMLGEHKSWATAYENPVLIKIPLAEIDPLTVSFTYGDSFVVFNHGKFNKEEYWGKVYFRDEILELIGRIGYPPQVEYDFKDENYTKYSPVADHLLYVEAHVWSDELLERYR
ncbi:MAG: hypothetical protein FWB93_03510 [Oscillospiraceae bacterium]|nr:hypothetical protein [Oscillospiraceae bacterium]